VFGIYPVFRIVPQDKMNTLEKLIVAGLIAVPPVLVPIFWLLALAEQRQVPFGAPAETAAERQRAEWDDAHAQDYQATVDTFGARMSELETEAGKVAAEHREATSKTEKSVLEEIDRELQGRTEMLRTRRQEAEAGLNRIRDRQRVLKGHLSLITGVTFSPDSKRVATIPTAARGRLAE
jgi:hypothetical protein